MPTSNKGLGKRVKDFRLMHEMTQNQAAVFFGVSMATYVRVEQGKGCGDLTSAKIEKRLTKQEAAA
jgi:DNA-binding XRE family transcriptional regulator